MYINIYFTKIQTKVPCEQTIYQQMVNSLCQPITGLRAYLLCLPCPSTGCRHKVTPQKILIHWQRGCFSKGYTRDKGKGRLSSGSGKGLHDFLEQAVKSGKGKKKEKRTPIFIQLFSVFYFHTHNYYDNNNKRPKKMCQNSESEKFMRENNCYSLSFMAKIQVSHRN